MGSPTMFMDSECAATQNVTMLTVSSMASVLYAVSTLLFTYERTLIESLYIWPTHVEQVFEYMT